MHLCRLNLASAHLLPLHRSTGGSQSDTPPSLSLHSVCRAMSHLISIWVEENKGFTTEETLYGRVGRFKALISLKWIGTVARRLCLPRILCPSFCPAADCVPLVLSNAPLQPFLSCWSSSFAIEPVPVSFRKSISSAGFLILVPSYETDTDTPKHSKKWYLWPKSSQTIEPAHFYAAWRFIRISCAQSICLQLRWAQDDQRAFFWSYWCGDQCLAACFNVWININVKWQLESLMAATRRLPTPSPPTIALRSMSLSLTPLAPIPVSKNSYGSRRYKLNCSSGKRKKKKPTQKSNWTTHTEIGISCIFYVDNWKLTWMDLQLCESGF